MTIEELRKTGWIVYEYVRGSHLYGLNTETSDFDFGGVFMCPNEILYGLRSDYIEQVSDSKGDIVFYELGRWVELLLKSNPTVLESLFVPEDKIITMHPLIKTFRDDRNLFLSKECFKTFFGYATSQIYKARGLKKKITNPITERKDVLDFCYTFANTGSIPFKEYLENTRLKQEYCGLASIPNMKDMYEVYYDWDENGKLGYKGIIASDNEKYTSDDVRLSSIPKGQRILTRISYNKDAYTCHCRNYKEYKDWEKNRNPVRYESNLGHNYDAKNISHCLRLIRMAKELALGKGFNLVRTYDRNLLLDIKNHKFEYEEVMEMVENEEKEMKIAVENTSLPDFPDYNKIDNLLIETRKKWGGIV